MLLGTDDNGRLWVNGEAVATTAGGRAATPEQDAVKVRLRKGVNGLLLKVANGNDPHGAYLSVVSGEELKVVK